MSLPKRILALAILVSASLLFALGLTELGLRAVDAMHPAAPVARGMFWKQNPVYGWLHYPGLEAPWNNDKGEFNVVVKINSMGLRDVEHSYEKPPGVFRILLLGDSYMEAIQVEQEQVFARQLEGILNGSGRRVEVINASAADWGTDNEYVYLKEEGYKYAPDLVLLEFTTANDVRNVSVELNSRVPNPNLYKPTFTLDDDGVLQMHPLPPVNSPNSGPAWWRSSRAISFFIDRLGIRFDTPRPTASGTPTTAASSHAPPPTASSSASSSAASSAASPVAAPAPASTTSPVPQVPTDMLVYSPKPVPEVVQAWHVAKELILATRTEAERRGARFALFLVNGPWAHVDESWNLMMMKDEEARKTWNRHQPNDVLGPFLWGKQVPTVDLYQPFEAAKSREKLFFASDPHWTPAGHRLAAEVVAKFLVERALVPPAHAAAER